MTDANGPQPDAGSLPSMPSRVAKLGSRKATHFRFAPEARDRDLIATSLGLQDLPRLELVGEIIPVGRHDYKLTAQLSARVVQSCVISLMPVPSNLAEAITRSYIRDYQTPEGDEMELPADDDSEPLPDVIDIAAIAIEALTLALPLYPRAKGAELKTTEYAPPGAEPIRESDLKPFAGLAGLSASLKAKDESQN